MDGTIIGFDSFCRDLEGFTDRKPTFEKAGYYRSSLRDFGEGVMALTLSAAQLRDYPLRSLCSFVAKNPGPAH